MKKREFISFTDEEIRKLRCLFTDTPNGKPLIYLNGNMTLKELKNFLKRYILIYVPETTK